MQLSKNHYSLSLSTVFTRQPRYKYQKLTIFSLEIGCRTRIMSPTTSKPSQFLDLPIELRLPIYQEGLRSTFHINQTFPTWTYEGKQLIPSRVQSNSNKSHKLLFHSAMRPLLLLASVTILRDEFQIMIAQPLSNRHIFKVTEQNIDDLATWNPPSSMTDYQHIIIGVTMSHWPNDLVLQPLRMQKLQNFAIRFTHAHHLTIYYYDASPRGPFDPTSRV
jgi:hypothetical protein